MFGHFGLERCVVIWDTKVSVGWVICGQQDIEEAVESAFADVTDVANPHDVIKIPRRRLPKGMSEGRKPNCKLFAKDIVVGHCSDVEINKDARNPSALIRGNIRTNGI